jgi:DNA-binding response OmpR family regulator
MDIACMSDNDQLYRRVERTLATLQSPITRYRSLADLARHLDRQRHDVVLLASELEHVGQFLACHQRESDAPVYILLSEDDGGSGLHRALDAGADDFVSTISGLPQLETRIRVCARRRTTATPQETLQVGPYRFRRGDGSVERNGETVSLTHREFLLAWVLFSNEGRMISTRSLADSIWGTSVDVAKRTIEQHAYRLRSKLGLGPRSAVRLAAVYGRGYRLTRVVPAEHEVWQHAGEASVVGESAPAPRRAFG